MHMTKTNQWMAQVDQLLQIDLEQLPLWLLSVRRFGRIFFPSLQAISDHIRESLTPTKPISFSFYACFFCFSGTTTYKGILARIWPCLRQ
jgi:hypothetical protein